jgi:hypothetical protein
MFGPNKRVPNLHSITSTQQPKKDNPKNQIPRHLETDGQEKQGTALMHPECIIPYGVLES